MAYDAVKMADWQISEAAEEHLKSIGDFQKELGLEKDEVIPYGRIGKLDFMKIINRLGKKPDGKYIEVTAITPTPLGEGKTTTSMGSHRRIGEEGEKCWGMHSPAFRWTHHEHQRERGRWRKRPGHSPDRIFHGAHRGYQRYHECPQPRHGGDKRPDAARGQLHG